MVLHLDLLPVVVHSTHPNYKLIITYDNKQSLSALSLSPLSDMCAILKEQIICSDNFSWSADTHCYMYTAVHFIQTLNFWKVWVSVGL